MIEHTKQKCGVCGEQINESILTWNYGQYPKCGNYVTFETENTDE